MPSEIKQMYLDKLVRKPMPKAVHSFLSNLSEQKSNTLEEGEIVDESGFVKIVDSRRSLKIQCETVWDKINRRVGTVFDKRKMGNKQNPAERRPRDDRFTSSYLETTLGKRYTRETNVPEEPLVVPEKIPVVSEEPVVYEEPVVSEDQPVVPSEIVEEELPDMDVFDVEEEPKEPKKKLKQPKEKQPRERESWETGKITKETMLNGRPVLPRLPKPEKIVMRASPYYMSNRKMYMQKLSELFRPYNREIADEIGNASCERQASEDFQLLIHQRIVRDYLNIYTPYRGLLLYHGLGSGKTCTSIALAEGMKTHLKIFVMTPASLKMNFFSELKKCGDSMYKKKQYWEFVSIRGQPQNVEILSDSLSLPREFILKHKGAWLMDVSKSESNYGELSGEEQQVLDSQLNAMIRSKYVDINYNGFNEARFQKLTLNETVNPFDHSVVLIDEAHNFVSRISNKLKSPESVSYKLYQLLLDADNVRIIFMTGTPMINYPNELGIMYNMLRGRIRTWTFAITENQRLIKSHLVDMFRRDGLNTYDYIDYSNGNLEITRNPFGFVNAELPRGKKRGGGGIGFSEKTIVEVLGLVEDVSTEDVSTEDDLVNQMEETFEPTKKQRKTPIRRLSTSKNTTRKRCFLHLPTSLPSAVSLRSPEKFEPNAIAIVSARDTETDLEGTTEKGTTEKGTTLEIPEEINAHVEEQVERELLEYANGMGDPHKGGATFGKGGATFGKCGATFGKGGDAISSDTYAGVYLNEQGNISDETFLSEVKRILRKNSIAFDAHVQVKNYTALPDDAEGFLQMFVEDATLTVKNVNLFKKRVLGLTSYFRSAQESLLPAFEKTESGDTYHIVPVEMSDYQIKNYFRIRVDEMKKEKNLKIIQASSKELYNTASSYRIFSRSACNFVFPPDIPRPMPKPSNKLSEERLDNMTDANTEDMYINENAAAPIEDREYNDRIHAVLAQLAAPSEDGQNMKSPYVSRDGLARFSPKFLRILENVESADHKGLHLLYSNFRSLEGIGIFKLVLEANGFAEFKLQRNGDVWEIKETDPDTTKPRFVLYTGTETNDEKEIIRNIYNSQWELVPASIAVKLREKAENNYYGEVVKVIMITASGAEGINLANTRYVHIMEPYWHMVRVDQVIGRARRICSHKNLPEELRTVKVFLYVSVFSEMQKVNRDYKEITLKDVSRQFQTPITTDESLYDIALLKNNINGQLLKSIKETAMDCRLYKKGNATEGLVCYGEGVSLDTTEFGIFPSIEEDRVVREDINVRKTTRKVSKFTEKGKNGQPDKVYARFNSSDKLYDWDAYDNSKQEILVGVYDAVNKRVILQY